MYAKIPHGFTRITFSVDSEIAFLLKNYDITEQNQLITMLLGNYFAEKQLFSESYKIESELLQIRERATLDISLMKNTDDIARKEDFIKRIDEQLEWIQEYHLDQRSLYMDGDINMAFILLNKRAKRFNYVIGVINHFCAVEINTILNNYPDFNIPEYIYQLKRSSLGH